MAGIGEKFKFLYNLFGFDNPDENDFAELEKQAKDAALNQTDEA